jgi:hypothetical protein
MAAVGRNMAGRGSILTLMVIMTYASPAMTIDTTWAVVLPCDVEVLVKGGDSGDLTLFLLEECRRLPSHLA